MSGTKLQDVAEKAGVSLATASLALSGKGRISPSVRARVQEVAGNLGYRGKQDGNGKPAARGTRIAILHAEDREYEWNFVRPTLLELERALHQRELCPVLVPFTARASSESILQPISTVGARAVFAVQYANEKVLSALEAGGIMVVVINNSQFQDRLYSVCVDDFQGAYEGTMSLLALGHTSVAFVEYERPDSPAVVADRFIGFRKALEEHHIVFSPDQRITIPFLDEKKLARKLGALFSRPDRPTAIFAHDDYLGLYVIAALKELGLEVPRDVSLVAPGDVLDYSLPFMPQITTMRINTSLLGRIAVDLMMERFRADHEEVHVLKVKEQLVRRESCAAAPGRAPCREPRAAAQGEVS
jgi:DNA-binding LacI/PurR family transcriptional regulator